MIKRKPIDTSRFRHLYPFKSNYMDLNGLQYHYLDEGAGDPVIMLHGNPTWSFYYRSLIKKLSPGYRIIVPDHIGCGLSDKPDLKRYDYRLKSRVDDLDSLFQHLNLKRKISLVVHDWGGIIGMAFALRHRKIIDRIVIMNTTAFLPLKNLPLRLWAVRNIKPLAAVSVLGFNLFSFGALFMASHKGLSREVKMGLTAPYNSWKNRIATLKFVQDIPVSEKDPSYQLVKDVDNNLHKIKDIPTLICWGEHDFVFDNDYLVECQRRFPKAKVHTFSNAGHYVLEDAQDRICTLVEKFFKQI
ncbi:MAG: alpha/beta fold hydrolase [Thermodesulfobacteriota bacterium]|nr:alpha/beta fold hydrolase [Thermodesulfobacteriota bacterium]